MQQFVTAKADPNNIAAAAVITVVAMNKSLVFKNPSAFRAPIGFENLTFGYTRPKAFPGTPLLRLAFLQASEVLAYCFGLLLSPLAAIYPIDIWIARRIAALGFGMSPSSLFWCHCHFAFLSIRVAAPSLGVKT